MNYSLAYRIGFHPWREEGGREPPYGAALDLGTGSGIWGVQLARRGWQVTGVDNVPSALRPDERWYRLRRSN